MPFLHHKTGDLQFSDGLCLGPNTSPEELSPGEEGLALLTAHPAAGGFLAPICHFESGKLKSVTLTPCDRDSRPLSGAERRRAYLFFAMELRDPCPKLGKNVKVCCPFGVIWLVTEPYTGDTTARIDYLC